MKTIPKPNYTQIPNIMLDSMMQDMGEAELKVVMAIARQTFGFHRKRKMMSLSYLAKATGMSRQGVLNGITAALESGIVRRRKAGLSWQYELIIEDEPVNEVDQSTSAASQRSRLELVNEVDHPDIKLVNEVDTRKKRTKENNHKETNNDDGSGAVFTFYQSNIGQLTSYDTEFIKDAIDVYGADTIIEAMKVAVKANIRNSFPTGSLNNRSNLMLSSSSISATTSVFLIL